MEGGKKKGGVDNTERMWRISEKGKTVRRKEEKEEDTTEGTTEKERKVDNWEARLYRRKKIRTVEAFVVISLW